MQTKLIDLGWKDETRVRLGVGSVQSFTAYMDRMTGQYGYDGSFLQEIDLADAGLLHENRLLFTVCDAYGAPVGFASRNLLFEAESRDWQARVDRILADPALTDAGRSEALAANNQARSPKYKNTSGRSKNVWYTKINLLFGFHLAKKAGAPLWVMEGYPDAVTAHDVGMTNVCAIGATAFTKEHVDVLIATGTKHILVVLDGDVEGYKATDRAVRVIEEAVGERIGFKVELIQMPEGSDDPDRFLRLYGRADFEALPRLDIFSWKIRRQMQTGSDPIQLCTEAIPLIVNEPSHLLRLKAARSLAVATGVPEETILAEIGRIVDQDRAKVAEEKGLILARMTSELKRSPESANEILRQAQTQIEMLEGAKEGYSPANVQADYDYVFEKQAAHVSDIEIATGFPLWDKKLGGLPRGAAFISVPGKPNQGKTSTCSNLAWRVPDLNPDVITLFHTVDDSLDKAIPRILGSKYGLPSKLWRKYGYYAQSIEGQNEVAEKWPAFPQIYRESREWLRHNLETERLMIADINRLAGSLPALEGWVRTIRKRFPNDPILCMGDNFALYALEVASDSEAVRARQKAQFVKRLGNTYQTCMFMTCELTKESLKPGIRPRMGNIKDTQGVAYDADCNLGIYNDLKDRGDAADLVWQDASEMVLTASDDGIPMMAPRRKPVLEMVVDKNKVTDYDGSIFYEFDMVSAQLKECSLKDQAILRQKAAIVATGNAATEANPSTCKGIGFGAARTKPSPSSEIH